MISFKVIYPAMEKAEKVPLLHQNIFARTARQSFHV